jgi:hypothetical protein
MTRCLTRTTLLALALAACGGDAAPRIDSAAPDTAAATPAPAEAPRARQRALGAPRGGVDTVVVQRDSLVLRPDSTIRVDTSWVPRVDTITVAWAETTYVAVPDPPPVLAALPQDSVALPALTTRRISAGSTAASLQKALDEATCGDAVVLPAGASYTGNFKLRAKACDGWMTLAGDVPLPPAGTRLTDAAARAINAPRLLAPGNNAPALATVGAAHHWRVQGVVITQASPNALGDLVVLGGTGTAQDALEEVPHHLVLSHVVVTGTPTLKLKRGVRLNSAHTAIVDSWVGEVHTVGQDAQAVSGWNGPGPFLIQNNYLSATTETVMFGGSDPSIPGLIPSDIIIRGNHFHRPLAWRSPRVFYPVKNHFESKASRRLLLEGNVFENHWSDGQPSVWNIKSANQNGGCNHCQTVDLTARDNYIRNVYSGISITGAEAYSGGTAVHPARVHIAGLVMDSVFGQRAFNVGTVHGLRVEGVTVRSGSSWGFLYAASGAPSGVVVTDVVAPRGSYGIRDLARFPAEQRFDGVYLRGSPIAALAGRGVTFTSSPPADAGADVDRILALAARAVAGHP